MNSEVMNLGMGCERYMQLTKMSTIFVSVVVRLEGTYHPISPGTVRL